MRIAFFYTLNILLAFFWIYFFLLRILFCSSLPILTCFTCDLLDLIPLYLRLIIYFLIEDFHSFLIVEKRFYLVPLNLHHLDLFLHHILFHLHHRIYCVVFVVFFRCFSFYSVFSYDKPYIYYSNIIIIHNNNRFILSSKYSYLLIERIISSIKAYYLY